MLGARSYFPGDGHQSQALPVDHIDLTPSTRLFLVLQYPIAQEPRTSLEPFLLLPFSWQLLLLSQ